MDTLLSKYPTKKKLIPLKSLEMISILVGHRGKK